MLAWVMNLGFAASDSAAPAAPVYGPGTFLLLGTCLAYMLGVTFG